MKTMEHISVSHWWNSYLHPSLSRLAIGRFLGDLRDDLKETLFKPGPKFRIYSGHDSTLGPLLGALKLYDGKFPPFGAMVNIETFAKEKEYFVRVLYNGEPMVLPACKTSHLEGQAEFCTLDAFLKAVDSAVPVDYDKECKS